MSFLQRIMAHRPDVQHHLEREEIAEGLDDQSRRGQRRPFSFDEQQLEADRLGEQRRQ
jgi:hypothetical protein